jgi:hypothetical protein
MTVIKAEGTFTTKRALEAADEPVIYDPEWSAGALLADYFKMVAEAAGLEWTDRHTADIFRAVELVATA